MKKIILAFGTIALLTTMSCNNSSEYETSTCEVKDENPISSNKKMISWEEMVVEINKAEYTSIGQGHDLIITLSKPDGTILKAKEPSIDAFMEIVKQCEKCKDIPILTE